MPNMQNEKVPMPTRDPIVRGRDFNEVETGYELEQAKLEAERCLNCKNKPCVEGCPVEVDIPGFIGRIAEGDVPGAFEILSAENALPAICGRVCPQETQCEIKCVRAVRGQPVGVG
ncbi:MAG: dihydropyrimidine dehydrogenase, partial [Oscillospiraceae bacterium]|nr:dihydropyrimidine dehydrogenase [Oscillospiraceae bacterium]